MKAQDPTTDHVPAVGEVLAGKYEVQGILGTGAMGVVLAAQHLHLRQTVAIKLVKRLYAFEPTALARFQREARIIAGLSSDHVVRVLDFGLLEDGTPFMVMQHLSGRSLAAELTARGGRLPPTEAVDLVIQACAGLAVAHAAGVVHRDIKPGNLFVTGGEGGERRLVILDFGISKSVAELGAGEETGLTASQSMLGSPHYMSPEQIRDPKSVDARTDLWALGVVLRVLLTGQQPFAARDLSAVLARVLESEPDPVRAVLPDLSPGLDDVLFRCLQKAPAFRWPSAGELAQALAPFASPPGAAIAARMARPGPSLRPSDPAPALTEGTLAATSHHATSPPRRRLGRVLAGALFAAALAGGGGVWLAERGRAAGPAPAPGPSSSATAVRAVRGVPLTEHPLPKSSNPEAIASYARALSKLRVGGTGAVDVLARAATADPSLGAAHLRNTLYEGCQYSIASELRASYVKAAALDATLDARDRAMLPLAELVSRTPKEPEAILAELGRLERASPEDAELAALQSCYARAFGHEDEADVAERRTLELDPRATRVLFEHAYQLAWVPGSSDEERARIIDRCLALSPDASGCLYYRATKVHGEADDCAGELVDARTLVGIEPEDAWSYAALAQGLAATGAPIDAVRNAFAQMEARLDTSSSVPHRVGEAEVAVMVGDFVAADALAADFEASLVTSSDLELHYVVTHFRIELAREVGDRAKALALADDLANRASAWGGACDWCVGAEGLFLRHQLHVVDDATFERERDRLAATLPEEGRGEASGRYAETPLEAKPVLPLDGGAPSSTEVLLSWNYGRILLLSGRRDEAIPVLTRAAHACNLVELVPQFGLWGVDRGFTVMHNRELLGRALESAGDRDGACRAYASVAVPWRNARPRSATAERALARMRGLGCEGE